MKLVKRTTGRSPRLASLLAGIGMILATLIGTGAAAASAATACDPAGDVCVVTPDTVQTPLGLVSVTVSNAKVVTVHLDPNSANTLVLGVPFSLPGGFVPGCPGGCTRTTIDTRGGLVTIDTIQLSSGRFALPNLAIISIHPPSPCRVRVTGATVVFTPIQSVP